jgi:hypothetical protein
VQVFARASSAVEGRNGYLSQMHHNHRGLPKRRYQVWTVLHNFDCRATDGTARRLGFLAGRFRISLKPCYLTSRPCLGRDNEIRPACEVADVMRCPALSGYPGARTADTTRKKTGMHLQPKSGVEFAKRHTTERGCQRLCREKYCLLIGAF